MKSTVAGPIRRFLTFAGLSAAILVVSLSSCQKKETPAVDKKDAPAQTPAAGTPVVPVPEDKVAATVNGTNIMESHVQRYMDLQYGPILAKYAQQSPQLAAQQAKIFREGVLEDLIARHLLEEQTKLANVQVTKEELEAEMTRQLSSLNPPRTIEEYKQAVEGQGGDFEAMKGLLGDRLRYHKLLDSKFAGALAVTEADAKKYYDENGSQFQTPEQVRASHILIATRPVDPNADPNQVKVQAKEKAEKLLKDIQGGADFAALAKENSSCPSSAQGGDLGVFPRGQMVKPFEDVAFGLQVGEVSELVETQFGYHIIKVTERHDPNQVAFEKAKPQITERLAQQKKMETFRKYVESLKEGAKIVMPSAPAAPAPTPSQPILAAPADANSKK